LRVEGKEKEKGGGLVTTGSTVETGGGNEPPSQEGRQGRKSLWEKRITAKETQKKASILFSDLTLRLNQRGRR